MPDEPDTGTSRNRVLLPAVILTLLTVLLQLASLAWNATQVFPSIALSSAVIIVVTTGPLAALGLKLSTATGLGARLLNALLSRQPDASRALGRDARVAIPVGLTAGTFLLLLRYLFASWLPPEFQPLAHTDLVGSLLKAAGAAVTEEIWFRLGVMTTLAWLFLKLSRRSELGPVAAWLAIVIAASMLGAVYVVQTGVTTAVDISWTLFVSIFIGVVCGWLYWRRSLIAAMLAHFGVELVLHVLPATLALPI